MPINKAHMYKSMVEQLSKTCQELQLQNERYIQRLTKIKKMDRRRKRDIIILKARLDKFKDNWRAISMKKQLAPHPKRKTEQKRGPKPKVKPLPDTQGQTIETPSNATTNQQQHQIHRLQFHQLQQNTGQIMETDWSALPFPLE